MQEVAICDKHSGVNNIKSCVKDQTYFCSARFDRARLAAFSELYGPNAYEKPHRRPDTKPIKKSGVTDN